MRTALIALACLAVTALATAQGPESTPKYPLTEREGPWLVHVASFRGDEALTYANNLSDELRTKHRLQAFVFSMEDPSAKQDREALLKHQREMIGSDKVPETGEKLKLRRVRLVKEFSVFVGSFKEHVDARTTLDTIKAFDPPTSIPAYGVHLYDEPTERVRASVNENSDLGLFGGFRTPTREVQGKKKKDWQGNPYRTAFVCRNPIVLQQQPTVRQQQVAVDPVWLELNKKERHSVFTCPKPWTLVVADFQPPTEVYGATRSVVQQAGYVSPAYGRYLEQCAEQARQLADILRDGGKGYDAYVFHMANRSIVTVGAFDSRTDKNMEAAFNALAEFAATQKTGPFSCLLKVPQPMPIPGK